MVDFRPVAYVVGRILIVLAILMLALRAYERGDPEMPVAPVEAWIAPYREVRL